MEELKQIKTMTLRDFIHQEMARYHRESVEVLEMPTEQAMNNIYKVLSKTARLIILQEIACRLEYGYITEIGTRSLKDHLGKPI